MNSAPSGRHRLSPMLTQFAILLGRHADLFIKGTVVAAAGAAIYVTQPQEKHAIFADKLLTIPRDCNAWAEMRPRVER